MSELVPGNREQQCQDEQHDADDGPHQRPTSTFLGPAVVVPAPVDPMPVDPAPIYTVLAAFSMIAAARLRAQSSVAQTSSTSRGLLRAWSASSRMRDSRSEMPVKDRWPRRKASTASSFAALNAAGTVPPAVPAAMARSSAGNASRSTGSNVHEHAAAKSHAAATRSSRCGQANASAMGSFMSGGLACAMVEPSTKVTMEWMTDCGCTTTSMRSYAMSNSRWASITSRPLFTSVAELMVCLLY